jgi:hypothetical protein
LSAAGAGATLDRMKTLRCLLLACTSLGVATTVAISGCAERPGKKKDDDAKKDKDAKKSDEKKDAEKSKDAKKSDD